MCKWTGDEARELVKEGVTEQNWYWDWWPVICAFVSTGHICETEQSVLPRNILTSLHQN